MKNEVDVLDSASLIVRTVSVDLVRVQCRFTSTETRQTIRDGHLDFHTAPELCCGGKATLNDYHAALYSPHVFAADANPRPEKYCV